MPSKKNVALNSIGQSTTTERASFFLRACIKSRVLSFNRNAHSSSFTRVLSRRHGVARRGAMPFAYAGRTNVRELTLATGRALMVSRVFTVALSFVRIIPCESTPSAGGTYQTRRSSHLPIYFQPVERPPAPSESTARFSAPDRNQCRPRSRRRRKAHGPR